ncbi:MAG: hypothetical protein H6643_12050 [Caldilineaceae bacterium]|nr:hypothetical protein [Caldilineaceae bacterium]
MQKQFMGIYEIDWDAKNEIVLAEPFAGYTVRRRSLAGLAERLPTCTAAGWVRLVDSWAHLRRVLGLGTHVHGWSCAPARDPCARWA